MIKFKRNSGFKKYEAEIQGLVDRVNSGDLPRTGTPFYGTFSDSISYQGLVYYNGETALKLTTWFGVFGIVASTGRTF